MQLQATTDPEEYSKCLKHAHKLKNQYFNPELDNIVDATIGSIMFRVLVEWDLFQGSEVGSIPAHAVVRKRVRLFMKRWQDQVEIEHEGELYRSF